MDAKRKRKKEGQREEKRKEKEKLGSVTKAQRRRGADEETGLCRPRNTV